MDNLVDLEWALDGSRLSVECLRDWDCDVKTVDELVGVLRTRKCEGIRSKIRDVGKSPKKLRAMMSEFEFAKWFTEKYEVKFIADDDKTYGTKPPDLMLSTPTGVQALVEVAQLSDGYLSERLEKELQSVCKRSRHKVHFHILGESARSALDSSKRDEQERLIERCREKVEHTIQRMSGVEKVETVDVEDIVINVWPEKLGNVGYYSGPSAGYALEIDTQAWRTYTAGILIEKAKTQLALNKKWSSAPFFVALHNKDSFFDKTDLEELLYETDMPIQDAFNVAIKNGSTTVVQERYPKLKSRPIATTPGIYLDIVPNLSGVYFKGPSSSPTLLTNPFCPSRSEEFS